MKKLVAVLAFFLIATAAWSGDEWADKRARLIRIIKDKGVTNAKVLAAMNKVQRHLFVPAAYRAQAYNDHPLPIGQDQTISQPYIVAFMTQALKLSGGEKVLEIGTGSGYQAAVLAEIVKDVYTIEILCPLATRAEKLLKKLDYANIHVRCGDGYKGWPDQAPFDAIIVTAAPEKIPQPLLDQLAVGGRMIVPVGRFFQNLIVVEKTEKGLIEKSVLPVRFVPMTGPGVEKQK